MAFICSLIALFVLLTVLEKTLAKILSVGLMVA